MYGANTHYASGNNVYDYAGYWNHDPLLFDSIWDTGGTDTIDFSGTSSNNRIDLRPGTVNSVAGGNNNLIITYHTVIENVTSGSGNDFLYGNAVSNTIVGGAGNDFMTSGSGADLMSGGAGDDIYEWLAGDGNDTIDEAAGAGVDELRLGYVPGMTANSDFYDLRFRLAGKDLVLDLNVDGTSEAEVTIKNQIWGKYRIETLNFTGTRVDLTSIVDQLSPSGTPSSFAISGTNSTNGFGYLAIKI